MPLIEVENLSVRYRTRREAALRGVTLRVEPGETVLLLGPSGSGKSTLTLCLNGLIPHHLKAEMEGSVRVDGQDTRQLKPGQLSKKIGLVFQEPEYLFTSLTAADEVAFGLENLGIAPERMDARIDEALGKIGLSGQRARRVDRLSGGQKQRLALACAIAMDTPALILDEPTAHLDPEATGRFYRELRHLQSDRTLILVEHKLDTCIHLMDRVLLLNPEGHLVANGPPYDVFRRFRRAIEEWGMWVPQVTEVTLRLGHAHEADPPLQLDGAVEFFKKRLPLSAPSPEEPEGVAPLNAPGARAFVVDRLSYSYPGSDDKALDEVSLSVPTGDFLALLGPNGAGKTTLAAHLAGVITPEPERVKLFGFDVGQLSPAELAERVGFVFQNPEHQFVTNSVTQEVAYSLRARIPAAWGKKAGTGEASRVEELLGILGLNGLESASPYSLSLGQKRRLSLGTMVAGPRRMLIVDEPTLGQDRRQGQTLMQFLQSLNRSGVTIVVITQDMRVAANYSRSTALLVDGKLVYHGSTRALFHQDVLLIRAGLWPPPLFDLTLELQRWQPDFPNLMTVDDYIHAFEQLSTRT